MVSSANPPPPPLSTPPHPPPYSFPLRTPHWSLRAALSSRTPQQGLLPGSVLGCKQRPSASCSTYAAVPFNTAVPCGAAAVEML